ncbi:acetyl-CoA synthetase-like protein [Ascodesmis nigricans]|uniref:Acetyl-CoA synthetase-like protein n=1 Tax=Ascodesmis nigricans TaxID=341454 RepID=A0A4S2N8M0_9PEZI|nr:acetyl-CoA synthetase-like protein [Ascodesmis nigricans]
MTVSVSLSAPLPRTPIFERLASNPLEKNAVLHANHDDPTAPPTRARSYGQLLRDVAETKRKLLDAQGAGVSDLEGKRIAMLIENSYEYVVGLLSIFAAGGIAVPICTTHPVAEQRYVLADSVPSTLLTSARFSERAAELISPPEITTQSQLLSLSDSDLSSAFSAPELVEFDLNRPALIIYTSGTTSLPKGVVHTHLSLGTQISALISAWKISSTDHLLHVLPLHHIHGIIPALMTPLSAGATVEFLPFKPAPVWSRLTTTLQPPITLFMAVPTIYTRLLGTNPQKLPNMRLAISGSASLPSSVRVAWDTATGAPLLERYGMSEIGMALSQPLSADSRIPGSVGLPLPEVEARLNPGDNELLIRGPNVFAQYWQREKANAEAFVESAELRGRWFLTGDVARVGATGEFYILGRKSVDVLKSGGEKVSALEVEREMLELPQVAEVAVLGVPDEEWGQRVAAVVVLKDEWKEKGWTLEEMRTEMKKRVAVQKVPAVLRVVDQIKRNAMGKVNKVDLGKEVFGIGK